jgi:hypothetical protein
MQKLVEEFTEIKSKSIEEMLFMFENSHFSYRDIHCISSDNLNMGTPSIPSFNIPDNMREHFYEIDKAFAQL